MNLTIRFLGCDLLSIDLSDSAPADEDTARDLSGGYLGSTVIEAGTTDLYLGFTNGRAE